jgi:hypothetical protein
MILGILKPYALDEDVEATFYDDDDEELFQAIENGTVDEYVAKWKDAATAPLIAQADRTLNQAIDQVEKGVLSGEYSSPRRRRAEQIRNLKRKRKYSKPVPRFGDTKSERSTFGKVAVDLDGHTATGELIAHSNGQAEVMLDGTGKVVTVPATWVRKHAAPIHPGTGSTQEPHGNWADDKGDGGERTEVRTKRPQFGRDAGYVTDVANWEKTKPWTWTKEQFETTPGWEYYEGSDRPVAAHNAGDRIAIWPNFLEPHFNEETRRLTLYHEVGHDVATSVLGSDQEWIELLAPFGDGQPPSVRTLYSLTWGGTKENGGFGQNAEETISDVWAFSLMYPNFLEDWEDPVWNAYGKRLKDHVMAHATKLGLPTSISKHGDGSHDEEDHGNWADGSEVDGVWTRDQLLTTIPGDYQNWESAFDLMDSEARAEPRLQALVEDIGRKGVQSPVVVFRFPDGRLTLATGHHRVWAATRADVSNIPVIVTEDWGEAQQLMGSQAEDRDTWHIEKHGVNTHNEEDHGNWADGTTTGQGKERGRESLPSTPTAQPPPPSPEVNAYQLLDYNSQRLATEFRPGIDDNPEIVALAQERFQIALAQEQAITPILTEVAARTGGEFQHFDQRVKFESSIREKIPRIQREHAEEGKPVPSNAEAAAQITDLNRYTLMFPADSYGMGVQATVDALTSQGWTTLKAKNAWSPGDGYDGINAKFTNGDAVFEMQFHTPESAAIKDRSHQLYQIARSPNTPPEQVQELQQQIFQLWNADRSFVPPGAETVFGTNYAYVGKAKGIAVSYYVKTDPTGDTFYRVRPDLSVEVLRVDGAWGPSSVLAVELAGMGGEVYEQATAGQAAQRAKVLRGDTPEVAEANRQLQGAIDEVEKHAQGSHDQKDHGNWARGLSARQIATSVDEPNEGFTRHYPTGTEPTTGFAVALPGHEAKIEIERVTEGWVRQYRKQHAEALGRADTNWGGWVEPNDSGGYDAYLDVSVVTDTYDEAAAIGAQSGQLAIYDIERGETLYLEAS